MPAAGSHLPPTKCRHDRGRAFRWHRLSAVSSVSMQPRGMKRSRAWSPTSAPRREARPGTSCNSAPPSGTSGTKAASPPRLPGSRTSSSRRCGRSPGRSANAPTTTTGTAEPTPSNRIDQQNKAASRGHDLRSPKAPVCWHPDARTTSGSSPPSLPRQHMMRTPRIRPDSPICALQYACDLASALWCDRRGRRRAHDERAIGFAAYRAAETPADRLQDPVQPFAVRIARVA
jgi:hypothetical protein